MRLYDLYVLYVFSQFVAWRVNEKSSILMLTLRNTSIEIDKLRMRKKQKGFKGSSTKLHFVPINSWFLIVASSSWSEYLLASYQAHLIGLQCFSLCPISACFSKELWNFSSCLQALVTDLPFKFSTHIFLFYWFSSRNLRVIIFKHLWFCFFFNICSQSSFIIMMYKDKRNIEHFHDGFREEIYKPDIWKALKVRRERHLMLWFW